MMQVLQRDEYFEGPRRLGDFFRLKKAKNGQPLEAVCEFWSHQLGWELKLVIAGELQRSAVLRAEADVFSTFEQWKAAMVGKGWS